MEDAFKKETSSEHTEWVRRLLVHYYDPTYDFHINMKTRMPSSR